LQAGRTAIGNVDL